MKKIKTAKDLILELENAYFIDTPNKFIRNLPKLKDVIDSQSKTNKNK